MPDKRNPIVAEANARRLVNALAQFSDGAACSEDLRIRYEQITGLRRQAYYDALAFCKSRHWVIGGGQSVPYRLNDDGCWRPTRTSEQEIQDRDRLAHMLDLQTQRNGELQSEVERLRDWSAGSDANGAGVAVAALVRIVTDGGATVRQKVKACAALLTYKIEDVAITEFVKSFLESLVANTDIAVDYRIQAGELLRQHESPRIKANTVALDYADNAKPAEPRPIPLSELLIERRRHCDELQAKMAQDLAAERAALADPKRNGSGDS